MKDRPKQTNNEKTIADMRKEFVAGCKCINFAFRFAIF